MRDLAKIGLAVGALYFAYRTAARGLVVGLDKALFKGIDLNRGIAQLQLNVSVRNPLPFGVKLRDVQGEIYSGGVQIGYVNTQFDYLVSGESVHVLPVIVNLTAQGVGEALWNNIQTGNVNNLQIAFDGKLHVTNFNVGIPLDLSFNWSDLVG